MRAELYPIRAVPVGRLAIMPRPRAGDWLEDEIASWRRDGLDVIVSLLQEDEVNELGLATEPQHCEQAGLVFLHSPIPDRGVPASRQSITHLVATIADNLNQGRGVGIHCRMGVGRAALLAACVLDALGQPLASAWEAIQQARGLTVPDTDEQKQWVANWAANR